MLAHTLSQLAARLAPEYELECVLVDDGSRDNTTSAAEKHFASFSKVVLIRHDAQSWARCGSAYWFWKSDWRSDLYYRFGLHVRPVEPSITIEGPG